MLSGDPVHRMCGVGKLDTSANERAAIVTLGSKPFVKAGKETLDSIRRPSGACFDKTRKPLPKELVLAPKCCHDEVFLGTKVFVERHAGDASFFENCIDTHSMKAPGAKHALRDREEMIPFSYSHILYIPDVLPMAQRY